MAEDTKTEMVLVPVEPTDVMLEAGQFAYLVEGDDGTQYGMEREIYRAMLAARPSADRAEGVGEPVGYRWRWKNCGAPWVYCDLAPGYRVHERDIEPVYAAGTDPALARLTEELIEETGSRDRADMVDMALVGHAVMDEIKSGGWSWDNSPAEVLVDLANKLHDAEAALAQRDADIAKAVEALEPFAQYPFYEGDRPEAYQLTGRHGPDGFKTVTVGDFRRARTALAALRASSATQADGGGK